ncbi:MAG: hypothetical protein JXB62_16610 [Pirellulales bacterium]|nr:hypothetical protein [Pirellulales bacterium]
MPVSPRFDVLGLGVVAVDDLLYVDEYPPADGKVRVRRRERQCGGLTGTALVAAARLGSRCSYAGRLGDDELSCFVMDRFREEGIDLTYRVRCDEAWPGHSTIIVDQRHKTRTVFSSLDGAVAADPSRPEAELIRAAGVLLIDHHGLEGTLRAVQIARQSGVGVVADFERDPGPPFDEVLALTDHLILSEQFARRLTGVQDPARAAEQLWRPDRRAVVVTGGSRGCWYVGPDAAQTRHFPAFSVEVVDTTGCGDVFHGAYASALAGAKDLYERIAVASAAAALKATRPGGQAGCPATGAVNAFLRARGFRV